MKKNILKAIITLVFIVGAIVSFNTDAKAYYPPGSVCDTYCPNSGLGCILVYSDGTMSTCVGAHT